MIIDMDRIILLLTGYIITTSMQILKFMFLIEKGRQWLFVFIEIPKQYLTLKSCWLVFKIFWWLSTLIDWLIHLSAFFSIEGHIAQNRNAGQEYNTLLLHLISIDPIDSFTHYLDCYAVGYTIKLLPERHAGSQSVSILWWFLVWSGREPKTYRKRGGHSNR